MRSGTRPRTETSACPSTSTPSSPPLHGWKLRRRAVAALGQNARAESLRLAYPFDLHGNAFQRLLDPLESRVEVRQIGRSFDLGPRPRRKRRGDHADRHAECDHRYADHRHDLIAVHAASMNI